MSKNYTISTSKSRLDVKCIYDFLNNDSYWAKGRSVETIQRSIDNSLCFGVYDGDRQVGFARVVTDYAVFAWIMDLFVLKEYRGLGLGKDLMDAIMGHPELKNLQRLGLATDDAHGLYAKYGFRLVARPEILMELVAAPS